MKYISFWLLCLWVWLLFIFLMFILISRVCNREFYQILAHFWHYLHIFDKKTSNANKWPWSYMCSRKCRTPQVYFEGETIKNLESELARASKLKCTSCGLKGAALGCYAKSCRRSYHVPCAVEVPDCRWDCVCLQYFLASLSLTVLPSYPNLEAWNFYICMLLQEAFIMLCPFHKSTKFPGENSRFKKRKSGEKSSLSLQMYGSVKIIIFTVVLCRLMLYNIVT